VSASTFGSSECATKRSSSSRSALDGSVPGAHSSRVLGQVRAHAGACSLEAAVHRRDARLEQGRRLLRREAEYVAHDQRGSLQRGQALDCHQERELDRLLRHHRGVRLRVAGDQLVEELIGVRLEPEHLPVGEACRGRLSSASRQAFVAIL